MLLVQVLLLMLLLMLMPLLILVPAVIAMRSREADAILMMLLRAVAFEAVAGAVAALVSMGKW